MTGWQSGRDWDGAWGVRTGVAGVGGLPTPRAGFTQKPIRALELAGRASRSAVDDPELPWGTPGEPLYRLAACLALVCPLSRFRNRLLYRISYLCVLVIIGISATF